MSVLRVNLRLLLGLGLGLSIGKTLLEDGLESNDVKVLVGVVGNVEFLVLLYSEGNITGSRVIFSDAFNADRGCWSGGSCNDIVSLVTYE